MTDPIEPDFDACVDKVIREFFESEFGDARFEDGEVDGSRPVDDPPMPDHIGPFRVIEQIDQGGIGIVLRVEDPSLGREVAVKVLRQRHRHDPEVVEQFLAEARVTGALTHPGVVPIHSIGRTDDGRPFFSMRIVQGNTLADLLHGRDSPEQDQRRFLGIFQNVCETLAFAHARGVVHRDVKPANIMVGSFGEVQVLDWGLALPMNGGKRNGAAGRAAQRVCGTPSYMAPEQARGAHANVDARVDVFALGAILCEILTGAPPYLAGSRQEIYLKAAKVWLDDAHRRLETCGGDPFLVALTLRCLATDPGLRPADAGVLAREIDGFLAARARRARELEVEAAESRARAAAERRVRRALAALVLVLLLGGAWYLWSAYERQVRAQEFELHATRALDRARLLAERARAGPFSRAGRWDEVVTAAEQALTFASGSDLSESLRSGAREFLARVRREREQARRDEAFVEWFTGPGRQLAEEVRARDLRDRYAAVLRRWGLDPERMPESECADRVRRSAIAETLLEALDRYAECARDAGASDGAYPLWKKLLRIAMHADRDRWRNRVRAACGDHDTERLLALARSPEVRAASAGALLLLARSLHRQGEYDGAIEVWRLAHQRYPDDYRIVHDLEQSLWHRGAPTRELLWLSLQGVTLRPKSSHAWMHLVNAYRLAGDSRMAALASRRVHDLDPNGSRSWSLAELRGVQLLAQGFLAEAESQLRDAIANDPNAFRARFQLARVLARMHRVDEAIAIYRRLLEVEDSAEVHCNLGLTLSLAGRFDAAVDELRHGEALGRARGDWRYDSPTWIEGVVRFQRMAADLDRLSTSAPPAEPEQRAILATVALRRDRPEAALRLFRSAFADEPDLVRNCSRVPRPHGTCYRVWAAAAAVRVATAPREAAGSRDPALRRECQRMARTWLQDELVALEEQALRRGNRVVLRTALSMLRHAPAFAPVRPDGGLETHASGEELLAWRALWRDVERRYRAPAPR